jgi:hypothetical protein
MEKPHTAPVAKQVVLVIDDDSLVCSSLKLSLEAEGFTVQTYSDPLWLSEKTRPRRTPASRAQRVLPAQKKQRGWGEGARTDLRESSRIPATETIRVSAAELGIRSSSLMPGSQQGCLRGPLVHRRDGRNCRSLGPIQR